MKVFYKLIAMTTIKEIQFCEGNKCSSCATCWRYHLWLTHDDSDDEAFIGFMPDDSGKCLNYLQREYYGG